MPINYDTDPLKHYVRRHGWLTTAREQKQAIKNRSKRIPLRYFTFCAANAIDIFMLEREGILKGSEDIAPMEGVYFCEKNFEDFETIAKLIGSAQRGFQGSFEDIVLFKDDEKTMGKKLEDELESDGYYAPEIRERLRYKERHHRLQEAFPFDIINLDVSDVMFPTGKEMIGPLLESIIKILEWQTRSKFPINGCECKQFTLFLTSEIRRDRTNETAIQQLENRVNENLCISERFKSAFTKQYGHDQVNQLITENFPEFFRVALFKFIIHKALSSTLGWTVTPGPTYLYNRDDKWKENEQYQIIHTVSAYKRIPNFQKRLDDPGRSEYIQSVTKLVNDRIQRVEQVIADPDVMHELAEDLKEITELRNQHHNS